MKPKAMEMDHRTLTVEQVAALLGKTPNTLRYDMCRHPERLPRWFKAPGNSRKPLFLAATVNEFLLRQARKFDACPQSGDER